MRAHWSSSGYHRFGIQSHERPIMWYRWIGDSEYLFIAIMFLSKKATREAGGKSEESMIVEKPRIMVYKANPNEKYMRWRLIKTLPLIRIHKFRARGHGIID